jgi:uncharacterized delta-60 repeat protein
MRSTHRTPIRIVLFNLLLCLVLCLSFAPTGLAGETEAEETTIHLPLVLRRSVPFIESSGALDTSFSQDGRVLTNFGGGDEWGYALVIQPDGKLIIAGTTFTGSSDDVVVARYHPDGSLDTSFSGDGKTATDVNYKDDYTFAAALQADGKILVAGTAWDTDRNFFLLRYNPDGSLDPTFDGDGKVMTNFLGSDEGHAIVIQEDGKILVAGFKSISGSADFALARYNPDGSLDTTFSGDGMLTVDFAGGIDYGYAVALQEDGKILMAGSSKGINYNYALARCNADGSLDATFDGDGKLTTDFTSGDDRANDLAVQGDGKIIAAGYATGTSADFAMARYNADGSLDTTFDTDGKLTTDFAGNGDIIYSVELQTGGKIVAAGYNNNPTNDDFALARYNADGSLDTGFAGDGMQVTDLAGGDDSAYSLVLMGDGRLVAAGYGYFNKYDFGAVRYNADGSLETTFSEDGILLCDLYGSVDSVAGAALQRDGKVVVVGYTMASSIDFAIARYNPDGSPDLGFGTDGIVTTDFALQPDFATAVAVQADGKLLVAGYNNDFILARYNPNGSLDTTFDGDGAVSTDFSGGGDYASVILLQGDGKIILAGISAGSIIGSTYDFALARYNSDGSLDTSFDGDGKVVNDLSGDSDHLQSAALQADGKIVVGGSSDGLALDFVLARYNANGSLDPTFDGDGLLSTDIDGDADACTALVVQPDGKILAAGYTANPSNYNFALVRYNPDGSLDPTFDGDGKLESDPTGSNDRIFGMALQPNGKIVVVGYGFGTLYDFLVARYNPDGSWDTTFDGDGWLFTDFIANRDYAYSVLVQPDGGIVVAGSALDIVASDFAVARYK